MLFAWTGRLVLGVKVCAIFRPCVPSLVYPQPLIRELSDVAFDNGGVESGDFTHIFFLVPGGRNLEWRINVKHESLLLFIPGDEDRKNRSPCAQRKRGNAGGGGSWNAEEIYKDPFVRLSVKVNENAECTARAQSSEHGTHGRAFIYGAVAESRASLFNQAFDERIINAARKET